MTPRKQVYEAVVTVRVVVRSESHLEATDRVNELINHFGDGQPGVHVAATWKSLSFVSVRDED